ncbi:hypothetical protein B0J15DRAFT_491279 [Fusarium solani]|jgi:amino acid permease|uniref:Uncharacterized protein n=1 Tax=Fusarium solani TaxID=169388 RepID=A0A9P9KFR4_FUSSL|nr:uncharacterized protein B0J15DRAFT_491279 [Fusarium solani]KAH7259843.1 hypothetical protein B0J15DRAFT_491279 [Fusarium solani]
MALKPYVKHDHSPANVSHVMQYIALQRNRFIAFLSSLVCFGQTVADSGRSFISGSKVIFFLFNVFVFDTNWIRACFLILDDVKTAVAKSTVVIMESPILAKP